VRRATAEEVVHRGDDVGEVDAGVAVEVERGEVARRSK